MNYLVAFMRIEQQLGRALTDNDKDELARRYGKWWSSEELGVVVARLRGSRCTCRVTPECRHEDPSCAVHVRLLPLAVAAVRIVELLKRPLTVAENQRLRAWFPKGVPESVIEATAEKLRRPRPELRIVK